LETRDTNTQLNSTVGFFVDTQHICIAASSFIDQVWWDISFNQTDEIDLLFPNHPTQTQTQAQAQTQAQVRA